MTVVKLAVGAELDLATGAELSDGLNGIKGMLDKGYARPLFLPFTAQRLGAGVLPVGRPPAGRIWNILSLTLVGNDDFTTLAGTTGALYIDADPGSLSLAQCRIPNQSIPSFQTFSDETVWAHSMGDVCINVRGALLATDQVIATITVAEWRESDVVDMMAMR
jgi:hypothetical protein